MPNRSKYDDEYPEESNNENFTRDGVEPKGSDSRNDNWEPPEDKKYDPAAAEGHAEESLVGYQTEERDHEDWHKEGQEGWTDEQKEEAATFEEGPPADELYDDEKKQWKS